MRPKRKRKAGPKTKAHRQAQGKRLQLPRGKLLFASVVMAFPLAAYFVGFGGVGQHSTAQISELLYNPSSVATASLGEEFTLDSLGYEVRGVVPRGRTLGFQKAEGRFIEVAIAVENLGAAKATVHAISLIDETATQYAQLPQFALNGTAYSEVLERGLEPGGAGTFFALFDVASGSTGLWLSFHARDGVADRIVRLGM